MESFPSSHSACAGGLLALLLLSPPTSHTPFPPGQNISPRFWFLHGHKTLGLPEGCLYIQQHFWRRDKLQFLHNKELRELQPSFRGLGFCLFSGKQLGHISPAHPIKPNRVPKNPKFQPGTRKAPAPNVAPVQISWEMDFPHSKGAVWNSQTAGTVPAAWQVPQGISSRGSRSTGTETLPGQIRACSQPRMREREKSHLEQL